MALNLEALARHLLADYDSSMPGQLFSQPLDLTNAEAYALQAEIARLREQRGEKVIGYKIGCTSQCIQEQLGVREPIFGRIFDTGCVPSGSCLSHQRYANLAVEGELALRLAEDMPNVPLADADILRAIEAVFPVIELHQYVLRSNRLSGPELIANNGMHAGLVWPDPSAGCFGLSEPVQALSICLDGRVTGSVVQPWTMGSPVKTLRWLSTRLAAMGLQLAKDQVILTGSPLNLYPVMPGNKIVVEAPPLGTSRAEIGH